MIWKVFQILSRLNNNPRAGFKRVPSGKHTPRKTPPNPRLLISPPVPNLGEPDVRGTASVT